MSHAVCPGLTLQLAVLSYKNTCTVSASSYSSMSQRKVDPGGRMPQFVDYFVISGLDSQALETDATLGENRAVCSRVHAPAWVWSLAR